MCRGIISTVSFSITSLLFVALLMSCEKESSLADAQPRSKKGGQGGNPHNPPPPSPAPFSLNCSAATINGSFLAGVPTNATITVPYTNSPGGTYPAYTSQSVNGITLTAPAGTLNVGNGSIVYNASGTPVNAGQFAYTVGISGAVGCMGVLTVLNAPVSGPNADPGSTVGSTGIINFTYNGQAVAYKTVRAKDGKIWLQQNLGSPQVAYHETDAASYGDLFQWGRWDDGHQSRSSATITGSASLMNPAHIPSGNPNFIIGTTAGTRWWSTGGLSSDSWSGTTVSSTNGKDPCAALGADWRLPTAAEWQNIANLEDLFGTIGAFQSNLKLPAAGYRYSVDGSVISYNSEIGYYWTSGADNSNAKVFFFDNLYNAGVVPSSRAEGFSCRCVKD